MIRGTVAAGSECSGGLVDVDFVKTWAMYAQRASAPCEGEDNIAAPRIVCGGVGGSLEDAFVVSLLSTLCRCATL
jgi:hypothetical protein